MSWTMWHTVGIGIALDEVKTDDFVSFCKNTKHKKAFEKYLASYKDGGKGVLSALDEMVKEDSIDPMLEVTDMGTLSEVIAGIMRIETDIDFYAPGLTDDGEDVVMFSEKYPWHMTEKERHLDLNKLLEIMRPYAEELKVPNSLGDYDLIYSG